MKRTSLMMLVAFAVLSCRALESDLCIAFDGVEKDMRDLRKDISKLSLRVQLLSATNSTSGDLLEDFAGILSLRDEFALRGKPQYQSMIVTNSTFPEISSGTIFKSDSYGHRFFFNGYFLTVGKVYLSSYLDEFGNKKIVQGFQFGLGNSPRFQESLEAGVNDAFFQSHPRLPHPIKYTFFFSNKLGKEILYPLKLTNQLHSVEFSAPQPMTHTDQPLTSGDTNGSNRAVGATQR
jgi:hypothetical protein